LRVLHNVSSNTWPCRQTTYTIFLELKGNVLGQLASDRNHDTAGSLEFVDIHDTLVAELFEVELVGDIEISAVGLSV
jgi:hypothetical protein